MLSAVADVAPPAQAALRWGFQNNAKKGTIRKNSTQAAELCSLHHMYLDRQAGS
jgi:hypothetical protein